jgi:hypothetical protein
LFIPRIVRNALTLHPVGKMFLMLKAGGTYTNHYALKLIQILPIHKK